MEAKVDIRKLQILNDRINQTLEALNQVRLTVHGLSHSSPFQQQSLYSTGIGQPFGFGATPFMPTPYGYPVNPAIAGIQGVPNIPAYGLQHASPFSVYNPTLGIPGIFGYGLQHSSPLGVLNPILSQGIGGFNPVLGGVGSPIPFPGIGIGGLLHSNPELAERTMLELRATDPTRLAVTFPYALTSQFQTLGIL